MADDEKILIAQFLRANDYAETLKSFLSEAGLPPDAGTTSKDGLTLEKLLQEKRAFDISADFEKLATNDTKGWRQPAPAVPTAVSLPTSSNILNAAVIARIHADGSRNDVLWSSAADRSVNISDPATLETLDTSRNNEAPVLSVAQSSRYLLHGDMAGNIVLSETQSRAVLDKRKDHRKYVVRVATYETSDGAWVATAGWDATVFVYWLRQDHASPSLGSPVGRISLLSNPEAVLFVLSAENTRPVLLVSRRDSTFIHYYRLPDIGNSPGAVCDLELLGRQNLAPHALSWVSFTPADMALCPADPSLIAVATSSMPHMKVLIVRLLFPTKDAATAVQSWASGESSLAVSSVGENTESSTMDVTSRARAELARQNREEAAILISCNAMAPQTQYSTPVVVWRPDGSGVWVSGDDGVIRGIDSASGKIVTKLESHESGSKIRCLWAGMVSGQQAGGGNEWLVSGGFDQRLIVWKQVE
ncbi:hypothetical protein NA57DRAFT_48005 [Rhizodiscina lignyota]|uniref:LisH domain-containing protein n=1 Tax=Rhizodiscina lignyota TaxID=1504668 RepID=A0A9P4I7W1_9PEZI|nr:hypothetical protein NA57DRAFT_48005 [Rhizodiscina lignyota]